VNDGALLGRIVAALDRAGIPHMLTGSFAGSAHGHLRATRDIDFVIDADAERLRGFVRSLSASQYYVDEEAALQALSDSGQFNVIDLATGWKVDLILRKPRDFSIEEWRFFVFIASMTSTSDAGRMRSGWPNSGPRCVEQCDQGPLASS
jgi:hypothetical protein